MIDSSPGVSGRVGHAPRQGTDVPQCWMRMCVCSPPPQKCPLSFRVSGKDRNPLWDRHEVSEATMSPWDSDSHTRIDLDTGQAGLAMCGEQSVQTQYTCTHI
jgi:hypothetical protein